MARLPREFGLGHDCTTLATGVEIYGAAEAGADVEVNIVIGCPFGVMASPHRSQLYLYFAALSPQVIAMAHRFLKKLGRPL